MSETLTAIDIEIFRRIKTKNLKTEKIIKNI